jgi:hypothetical protein
MMPAHFATLPKLRHWHLKWMHHEVHMASMVRTYYALFMPFKVQKKTED